MRILVIGAGPGGLYASLLLKKLNPAHDIEVVERNPRGATYGWGVVFSSLTLTSFREADYKSYKDITDQFVLWNPIEVRYRGQVIRCDGHTFAGMSRRKLLDILAERCAELGIRITYETELTDFSTFDSADADSPSPAEPAYDLVIAADGVNSLVRKAYAEAFKPTLRAGKARYVWYGTHRVFDAFTFSIRQNEHGLFQAHCYPFDGDTSTFIVECDEDSWLAAGLDKADEAASIAYCERLFAEDLRGYSLLSNRSLWTTFTEVTNKAWSHKNIVLLGDAVHTAHFSIGSGTRLAMEDAIALANAFEIHGDDVPAALRAYELERRPRVEIIQKAARESQAYFENLKRYAHLEPQQFVFHLLTRSERLNYDNLKLRDPHYIDGVARWFHDQHSGNSAQAIVAPPPLHTPFALREVRLANRIVLSPAPTYSFRDGLVDGDYRERVMRLALGGAGLILTEPTAVSPAARITPGCPGCYTDAQAGKWAEIVAEIHASTPAKAALLLSHAGRRGATRPRQYGLDKPLQQGSWPLLSASPLPYTARSQTPAEMTRADMDAVRDDFVRAAQRADQAGFDLLALHMAHGYLLCSFLSPLTNRRADEYGGSLENRLRYPLEVFDAVRAVWPAGKPLAVSLNASDWAPGGLDVADAAAIANALKARGCDLIYPLAGQSVPDDAPNYDANFLADYSEYIRNDARIATMTSGGITTTNQINTLLAAGVADLCLMDPPHLRG